MTEQTAASLIEGIKIIDVDTHLSEPHDLWQKRAPASLKGSLPRVVNRDGKQAWVIGEDILLTDPMIGAAPISVVRKDGSKDRSLGFFGMKIDEVHAASYNGAERVKMMDASNIHAQIIYPNVLGFGGQNGKNADEALRIASIEIFNDAMAEMQVDSGGRIYPMALIPWWEVKKAVAEVRRAHAMGLRGININSDPHLHGLPPLGDRYWDPLWEACTELEMPVNFHIGASDSAQDWYGMQAWPGGSADLQFALSSSMIFFSNARVMANIIFSGILDRHPTIKFVSVESGLGWVPFLLESLEYQLAENAGNAKLALTPSEYFHRNMYASFWFERRNLGEMVRQVGVDNVMFETDFPHPTCLYPTPMDQVSEGLAQLDFESRSKILSKNAAKLYRIPIN